MVLGPVLGVYFSLLMPFNLVLVRIALANQRTVKILAEETPKKKRGGKRANHKPRASSAEIELRVQKVIEMLLDGYTNFELAKFSKSEWGVGQSGIDAYIRKANVLIKESVNVERDEYIARKLSQLDILYRRASNCEQFSAATGALKLQTELGRLIDK